MIVFIAEMINGGDFTSSFLKAVPVFLPSVAVGFAIISFFYLNKRKGKRVITISAIILALLKTIYFFVWFFLVFIHNIRAIAFRIGGNATTAATAADYVIFI